MKMDILPRVHFFASMFPLSPPSNYWNKLHFLMLRFIWGGKQPRVKITTLQSLSVPNFKYYFWSFVLRPLSTWLNPDAFVSWKPIEENIALPRRLEDLVFSNMLLKESKLYLGPIISFELSTWCIAEKETKTNLKWHLDTPIFNNCLLLTGWVPFSSTWPSKKVQKLADIFNENGLRSFNDIRSTFNLPGSSFFLYLQLQDHHSKHMAYHGMILWDHITYILS